MNPVNHPTQWTATEVLGRLAILIDPLRRRTERERRPRTYGRAILHPSQHSHGRSAAAQRRATQVGPSDEEGLRRVALYPDGCRWLRLAERYVVDDMTVRRYLLVAGSLWVAVRAPATAAVGHAATTDSGQIQLTLKCPEPIVHGPFHSRLVYGKYRMSSVSAIGARCLSSWRRHS